MHICPFPNYGICEVLDTTLSLYGDNSEIKVPDSKTLWDHSITFAKSLITHYKDKKGFNIGFYPDETGKLVYRFTDNFELGCCGQNVLFARMLIEDHIRFGHKDSLDEALEILDTCIASCTAKSGLLAAQLADFEHLDTAITDTCNMGYGGYELIRTYLTLQKIGIDKPDYLANAEQAMRFYMECDLDRFICTAGALDICCVDKETSFPFIVSGILLYEVTKNEKYIEYAVKAVYYFTSWMFHYDPVYDEDSEAYEYGVTAKKMTSVSAQHHHLDMYAGIAVPYLRKLAI